MPPFRVPPVPGLTELLPSREHSPMMDGPGGPMGKMVHTTAMRLVEEAISLLRKAARLDPMLRARVSDALEPFGASTPDDDSDNQSGEPMRPRGLQSPSQNY